MLTDSNDIPLSWVVGGEMVKLKVRCQAQKFIFSPIVGFIVKDRLGQSLFAENTCITYMKNPLSVEAGQEISCDFTFRMPILPNGDYSIMVSIAEGTQHEHNQLHWLHDALIFKSHASCTLALMGIPIKEVTMEAK